MKLLLNRWTLLIGFMLLIVAVPVYITLSTQFPSDEELVAFFEKNKAGFDQLRRELAKEPASIRGFSGTQVLLRGEPGNWVSPNKAGVTPSRFQEMQRQMREHEVDFLWRQEGMTLIRAGFSGWGSATKGPRLCYIYMPQLPSHRVSKLMEIREEKYQLPDQDWHLVYKPLGGNWYIRLIW